MRAQRDGMKRRFDGTDRRDGGGTRNAISSNEGARAGSGSGTENSQDVNVKGVSMVDNR